MKAWAIRTATGHIWLDTISDRRRDAIRRYYGNTTAQEWEEARRDGNRAVRVNVTIAKPAKVRHG